MGTVCTPDHTRDITNWCATHPDLDPARVQARITNRVARSLPLGVTWDPTTRRLTGPPGIPASDLLTAWQHAWDNWFDISTNEWEHPSAP